MAETAAHVFYATGNDAQLLSSLATDIARDSLVRVVSGELNKIHGLETTPLYNLNFPRMPPRQSGGGTAHHDVLRVALDSLPLPDDLCSWQDIFDFKAELHDKKWAFHRFLKMLATKPMSAPEVRDEIEWMVNEFTKAMRIHHIKASRSFADVFLISPLEIIENFMNFEWSKIAKGGLSVDKRRIELLGSEMKAAGRECAYVFDTRKRFGQEHVLIEQPRSTHRVRASASQH